jgi:hypothetical protein
MVTRLRRTRRVASAAAGVNEDRPSRDHRRHTPIVACAHRCTPTHPAESQRYMAEANKGQGTLNSERGSACGGSCSATGWSEVREPGVVGR